MGESTAHGPKRVYYNGSRNSVTVARITEISGYGYFLLRVLFARLTDS